MLGLKLNHVSKRGHRSYSLDVIAAGGVSVCCDINMMILLLQPLSHWHYISKQVSVKKEMCREKLSLFASSNIQPATLTYIYIYIIVEKSPNSSHMYDHGFMDNTNRQAVCKSQKNPLSDSQTAEELHWKP